MQDRLDEACGTDLAARIADASRFDLLRERLGSGLHGYVQRAVHRSTGDSVAVKSIDVGSDESARNSAVREISALRAIKSSYVVPFLGAAQLGESVFVIMRLFPMDLARRMKSKRLEPDEVRCLCRQMFAGLADIHAAGYIHRDMKPQNLLVDEDHLCIADFGFAQRADSCSDDIVGTLRYRAPELLLGTDAQTTAVDVWAAGAIFLEMANNEQPFPGRNEFDQLLRVFKRVGTPTVDTWPDVFTMPLWSPLLPSWEPQTPLSQFLNTDGLVVASDALRSYPANRPTAQALSQYAYFTGEVA